MERRHCYYERSHKPPQFAGDRKIEFLMDTVARLVQVQRVDCVDFLGKTWQTACLCRAPKMARLADQQHAANSREYSAFWPLAAPGPALTLLKCRKISRFCWRRARGRGKLVPMRKGPSPGQVLDRPSRLAAFATAILNS